MKVALFVNGFPDANRPHYSVFNLRTAKALARLVDLQVIVPMAMKPGRRLLALESWNGLQLIRASAPALPRMEKLTLRSFVWMLRRTLRPFLTGLDILHSVGVEFSGLLAGALNETNSYCHVTQLMNNLFCFKGGSFGTFPYLEDTQKRLRGIICNSRELETAARRFFPKVGLVRTLYRGTDLSIFQPSERVERNGNPIRFLFLGGLPSYPDRTYKQNTKGGLTLMQAWKDGEEELHQAGATLLFGGPDSRGPLVEQWVASLSHRDDVLLGGLIAPDDVPERLRWADVVLMPSLEEGCPNLVFEASACGTPVFGSDIGPLCELMHHTVDGLLIRAGDVSAWKSALVEYCRPEARQRLLPMGQAARTKAEAMFDHREYARKLVEFYRDALKES